MPELPPEIDTSRPHPARMYDYGLGGKNHFAADREAAEKVLASWPSARAAVPVSEWRPEGARPRPTAAEVSVYGGVARKP